MPNTSLVEMNEQQFIAVTSDAETIRCLAGAGSGKTRVLTGRMGYLHNEKRVGTSNMLALTFTRLAAKEMKDRLSKLIGPAEAKKLFVGTFHSFCVKVLREWGSQIGIEPNFTVYDEEDRQALLQAIITDLGAKKVKISVVIANMQVWDKAWFASDGDIGRVAMEYYYRLRQHNALDLDLLLHRTNDLLDIDQVRDYYRNIYRYVFVDEFQDTSSSQTGILTKLSPEFLFVVGDDFQCQPPGTMVETPGGLVPIEKLKDGDKVLAWNRKNQYVTSTGYEIHVGRRNFAGNLIKVSADGKTTKTTPNHKFLVRWASRDSEVWVTYLMFRADRGYRVGWCQLFTKQGSMHLATRANLEKADKTWILGVHLSKKEATVNESIISIKYGIPTCMFEPNGELYDNEVLTQIFNNASSINGERCLIEHNKHLDFPLWPYPNHRDKHGRPTYFECYASNLLPGYMSIPLPGEKRNLNQWAIVASAESEHYSGPVYSLDVNTHHNYVADGLVTLNSIYGWRGANPYTLINFGPISGFPEAETVKLETNYRSTIPIVEAANQLIANNENQTEKTLNTDKDGSPIVYNEFDNERAEFEFVASTIKKMMEDGSYSWADYAVLARTNKQLQRLEEILNIWQVPCKIVNAGGDIFKKPVVKGVLDFIAAASNPTDNVTVKKAFSFPEPRATALQMDKWELKSLQDDIPLLDVIENSAEPGANEFDCLIRKMRQVLQEDGQDVEDVFGRGYRLLQVQEAMETKGLENRWNDIQEALCQIIRWKDVQRKLGASISYDVFLRWLRTKDIQERLLQEEEDSVRLLTVHAAKGLEFPYVFIIGMNQGVFPSKRSEDIEEERRLCYVAITRAKDYLVVSRAKERVVWGEHTEPTMPSQFLNEAGI